jgi:hypothetical protein
VRRAVRGDLLLDPRRRGTGVRDVKINCTNSGAKAGSLYKTLRLPRKIRAQNIRTKSRHQAHDGLPEVTRAADDPQTAALEIERIRGVRAHAIWIERRL